MAVVLFTAAQVKAQTSVETLAGAMNTYSYYDGDTKPDTPTSTEEYYYDANGLKVLSVSVYSMYKYTYDANGVLTEKAYYYSNNDMWELSSYYGYEYDESGNVTRENQYNTDHELSYYSVYEGYENGVYADYKSMSLDGTVTYWLHNENTFENGLLTQQVQYYKSSEEDAGTILSKSEYSYTDGVLMTVTNYSYDSTNDTYSDAGSISYTYNTDGQVASKNEISIYSYSGYSYTSYYDYEFDYNSYSSSYAPTNFSVANGTEINTLVLSWDAATSSDVTGYMVFVDGIIEDVITSTSYTTSALVNGDHTVAVVAVVNGAASNISDIQTVSVVDEGTVAPENFRVVSISDVNEDGSYDVELAWDAPTTSSTLTGYRVYYSSYSYEEVDASATTITINFSSYYAIGTDYETGDEYGYDITLYAKAVYNTGISDASNSVIVNCYDSTVTGIEDFVSPVTKVAVYPNPASSIVNFSEPVSVKIYTLTGKLALIEAGYVDNVSVDGLANGVYIVETTSVTGAKTQTKLMIK